MRYIRCFLLDKTLELPNILIGRAASVVPALGLLAQIVLYSRALIGFLIEICEEDYA